MSTKRRVDSKAEQFVGNVCFALVIALSLWIVGYSLWQLVALLR